VGNFFSDLTEDPMRVVGAAMGGAVAVFVLVWSDRKLKKQRVQ